MFLPAISFSIGKSQVSQSQGLQSRQQDFKEIAQSLKGGDLTSAKTAFGALQQGLQAVKNSQPSNQTTNATNSTNPLGTDIQGLSQSLKSGDLAGAQKALDTLVQDLQGALASQGAQYHLHHQAVAASQAAAAYSSNGAATGAPGLQTIAPVNLTA